MGLISYIKRERERRFRFEVLKAVGASNGDLYGIYMRFLNGDDKAILELPEYKKFKEWQYKERIKKLAKG